MNIQAQQHNRRNSIYPPRRYGRFDRKPAEPESRINDMIRGVPEVRLIDHEGKQVGIVPLQQAQDMAREKDLDLVEISPTAAPPVCKIMDYGKYVFQQKKKQSEAKKKQKVIIVKEVQFRPRIDEHDFDFKKNNIVRFLQHGDKVKAIIRFRGREMTHMELGRAVLDRLLTEIKEIGASENPNPDVQGNRMSIIIAPNK
ncbi:MAG TPA: translation initiation factor IF-3 [Thermoanaerobaculia bacterium]|nr:translation initiation factor IF-3 [Thermoanaerobaculia bacterium]